MPTQRPRLFFTCVLLLSAFAASAFALSREPASTSPAAKESPQADRERSTPAPPQLSFDIGDMRHVRLESPDFEAVLSNNGGAIEHFRLREKRFTAANGKPIDLVTTDRPAYLPFRVVIAGVNLPPNAVWSVEQLSPQAARFTYVAGDLLIVRKIEVGQGPFQLWSTLNVINRGKTERPLEVSIEGYHYVRRQDEKGGFMAGRSPLTASGLCVEDDTPKRFERADVVEDKPVLEGAVNFGSVDTIYFTQAYAGNAKTFNRCALSGSDRGGSEDEPEGSLLTVSLRYPTVKALPNSQNLFRTLAYVGPKLPETLAAAGHSLRRASFVGGLPGVDSIANGLLAMLAFIHQWVPNWGVAIILLTFFVKLVLYPLTAKSFQSIAAMRRLKPGDRRPQRAVQGRPREEGRGDDGALQEAQDQPVRGLLAAALAAAHLVGPVHVAFH
ncbi:MAG: YidC/Oxa1 family insertase periplasmic-domain containing protein [Myxococcales bacterium]